MLSSQLQGLRRFQVVNYILFRVSIRLAYAKNAQTLATTAVRRALSLVMYYYGAYLVVHDELTVASFIGYLLYVGYMINATTTMTSVYTIVKYVLLFFPSVLPKTNVNRMFFPHRQGTGAALRIFTVLHKPPRKNYGKYSATVKVNLSKS
jgi:hypothetical protein